jgi:hypothetical protein
VRRAICDALACNPTLTRSRRRGRNRADSARVPRAERYG